MGIKSTDHTPRLLFIFKMEYISNLNMKPEGLVFIYNPLEKDGFYGSRKCEGFLQRSY